jgi:hypothetical protein
MNCGALADQCGDCEFKFLNLMRIAELSHRFRICSVTIGPVAVLSQLTGTIVAQIQKEHPKLKANQIASVLALLAGAFVFTLGILRLGYVPLKPRNRTRKLFP